MAIDPKKENKFKRSKSDKEKIKRKTTSVEEQKEKLNRNVEYINDHQNESEYQDSNTIISEKSFFRNVKNKVSNFLKTKARDIAKGAKKFFRQIATDFMAPKTKDKFKPGTMVAFTYSAKDVTKTFDKKPLIISLGWSKKHKGRFLGLNMHWMPVKDRVALAGFFAELAEKKGGVTYNDIKPFMKKFKGNPILRMYIYDRVSGKVIDMPKDQFMTAAALPTEQWIRGK